MTTEQAYRQFLEETTERLTKLEIVYEFDECNRSFRYQHVYKIHDVDVHLVYDEVFNRYFKSVPCFLYMYEAICYVEDGIIERKWDIHFNNEIDDPYVLEVHFKPEAGKVGLTVGFYYLNPEKSRAYFFRRVEKKHITEDLQNLINEFIDVMVTLPPFRLLDVTGSLRISYN